MRSAYVSYVWMRLPSVDECQVYVCADRQATVTYHLVWSHCINKRINVLQYTSSSRASLGAYRYLDILMQQPDVPDQECKMLNLTNKGHSLNLTNKGHSLNLTNKGHSVWIIGSMMAIDSCMACAWAHTTFALRRSLHRRGLVQHLCESTVLYCRANKCHVRHFFGHRAMTVVCMPVVCLSLVLLDWPSSLVVGYKYPCGAPAENGPLVPSPSAISKKTFFCWANSSFEFVRFRFTLFFGLFCSSRESI